MRPDISTTLIAGVNAPADLGAVGRILFRNSLVLALHALACVAGFIAGASLPLQIEHKTGVSRVIHEKAGPFAIAFVTGATLFSLVTQAWVLGSIGADARDAARHLAADAHPDAAAARDPRARRRSSCRWPPGSSRAGATSGRSCSRRRS